MVMATKKNLKPVSQNEFHDISASLGIPKALIPGTTKYVTLEIFKSAPQGEFRTEEVWTAVHQKLPHVKKDTVLTVVTELKKAGLIQHVRNDGHYQVLRLSPAEVTGFQPESESEAADEDTLAVLKQLTNLVEQRAVIDAEIERLKILI
jgi:Fe2+ or Zn2+ uptake regulation protein